MSPTDAVPSGARPLPVVGQPRERADAARNRRTLVAAARRLLVESGIDALQMDRVATEACVGIGTVYRRFGDRAGLAFALLDDSEQEFQAAYISGPPPLGPGAPPEVRIRAFLHAYVDRLETEAPIHAIGESRSPTHRYEVGAYRTARAHLIALLNEAGTTVTDVAFAADAILALLGAGLFLHQRRTLGYSIERIKAGLDSTLAAVLTADPAVAPWP